MNECIKRVFDMILHTYVYVYDSYASLLQKTKTRQMIYIDKNDTYHSIYYNEIVDKLKDIQLLYVYNDTNEYIRCFRPEELHENNLIQFSKSMSKPFIHMSVICKNGTEYNIYDKVKAFFVSGNIINRDLIRVLMKSKYNYTLQEHDKIQIMNQDISFQIVSDDFEFKI